MQELPERKVTYIHIQERMDRLQKSVESTGKQLRTDKGRTQALLGVAGGFNLFDVRSAVATFRTAGRLVQGLV